MTESWIIELDNLGVPFIAFLRTPKSSAMISITLFSICVLLECQY